MPSVDETQKRAGWTDETLLTLVFNILDGDEFHGVMGRLEDALEARADEEERMGSGE